MGLITRFREIESGTNEAPAAASLGLLEAFPRGSRSTNDLLHLVFPAGFSPAPHRQLPSLDLPAAPAAPKADLCTGASFGPVQYLSSPRPRPRHLGPRRPIRQRKVDLDLQPPPPALKAAPRALRRPPSHPAPRSRPHFHSTIDLRHIFGSSTTTTTLEQTPADAPEIPSTPPRLSAKTLGRLSVDVRWKAASARFVLDPDLDWSTFRRAVADAWLLREPPLQLSYDDPRTEIRVPLRSHEDWRLALEAALRQFGGRLALDLTSPAPKVRPCPSQPLLGSGSASPTADCRRRRAAVADELYARMLQASRGLVH